MTGNPIFALTFILIAMIGAYVSIFIDLGGHKTMGEVITRLIKSHADKRKKDI